MEITRSQIRQAMRTHGTDKLELHGYDQMYTTLFNKLDSVDKLLEIGVYKGKSLATWLDLFPNAEIVGVDIRERDDVVDAAKAASIIIADSARSSIKETVGTGFDVIIDDGDHRPDWQTQTFINLQGCWTKAYVIEDVIGLDHEKTLRRRLASLGYTDVHTFESKIQNFPMRMSGVIKNVTFYAMVVYPKS